MDRYPGTHFKRCCTCKKTLPIAMFYKDKGQDDGHEWRCKICRNASVQKTYLANKERYIAVRGEWGRRNREKLRARERASYKKLFKENPGRYRDKIRRRQLAVKRATPIWETEEDKKIIRELYDLAKEGEHVDHIIPLKHPLACGLHTPNNMQIVDEFSNTSKNNRLDLLSLNPWPSCEWPRKIKRPRFL